MSPLAAEARALAGWIAAALGTGSAAALGLPQTGPAAPPVVFSDQLGGPFALTATDGRTVSDQSLRGAPYVLLFGYTRCGVPCRARLDRLAQWRAQMGSAAAGLRIVLVSVDPAGDTPARMAAFLRQMDAPIIGLTGSAEAIGATTRAFNAVHFTAPLCGGGYTITHSEAAFLIDRAGRAQAIIAADEADHAALAKLQRLIAA